MPELQRRVPQSRLVLSCAKSGRSLQIRPQRGVRSFAPPSTAPAAGPPPIRPPGARAPTPPPRAPGPVATPSPGASDHLHRADANPRGSTEISNANAKFRGIHTTTIPCAMVFSQVCRLQLPPPALVPLCTRPITFTLSSAPLCPLPRPADSRNTLTSRSLDGAASRARRRGVRADAPPSITPEM